MFVICGDIAQRPCDARGRQATGQSEIHRSFSVPLSASASKSSGKLANVHRFLWRNWQRKQRAVVDVTFWGTDFGAVYTVYIRPDESGHWTVTEYVRHYQLPEREPEGTNLVATGIDLRPRRLRSGAFVVRLVNQHGITLPLFE